MLSVMSIEMLAEICVACTDGRYLIVNQLQTHGRISQWAIIITYLYLPSYLLQSSHIYKYLKEKLRTTQQQTTLLTFLATVVPVAVLTMGFTSNLMILGEMFCWLLVGCLVSVVDQPAIKWWPKDFESDLRWLALSHTEMETFLMLLSRRCWGQIVLCRV